MLLASREAWLGALIWPAGGLGKAGLVLGFWVGNWGRLVGWNRRAAGYV